MGATANRARRTASRAERREQLIAATIKCIARKGISGTTLADVAREACLSQGIVNLHFKSKNNLLQETLRHLADEYRRHFDGALETAGPSAAAQLMALMELDLRADICDEEKVAVWFAFWGEVGSRPTYRKMCDEFDQFYDDTIAGLCTDIIAEGGYRNVSAAEVALALNSMTNGMWLSYLISPRAFDRGRALGAIAGYLGVVFPEHFP